MVPVDGSVPAFYVVDPATGSMLAILFDGSGGGLSASDQALASATLKVLDLMSAAGNFAGASFGFGAVIALQAAILKVVIAESELSGETGFPLHRAPIRLAKRRAAWRATWRRTPSRYRCPSSVRSRAGLTSQATVSAAVAPEWRQSLRSAAYAELGIILL